MLMDDRHDVCDSRGVRNCRLDLAELDPSAAQLDLVRGNSAEELYRKFPIFGLDDSRAVTGTVEAAVFSTRDESCGSLLWSIQIALADLRTTDGKPVFVPEACLLLRCFEAFCSGAVVSGYRRCINWLNVRFSTNGQIIG